MFLTDVQLLSDLADTIQKNVSDLQGYWSNALSQSHSWAWTQIVQRLMARGYTLSQINSWDQPYGADYERNLTLWAVLCRSAAMQAVEERTIGMFDVRKDLDEVMLIVGGIAAYPAGDPGTVGVGDVSTESDIFVLPPSGGFDPFDDFPGEGRGQETRL